MVINNYTLVIFGGTGDLAHRKLLPALYNLEYEELLTENINIVSLGRRKYSIDEYLNEVNRSIKNYSRLDFRPAIWDKLKSKINYLKIDYNCSESYPQLNDYLINLESKYQQSQRIYYLAVSPEHFEGIVENLKVNQMNLVKDLPARIVIEKPFGKDLTSAEYLNDKIINVFSEENTYRIDHYLGKEMMQNIMVIRFANLMFEPIWNNQYIKRVDIISSETLGIGTRGNYYEHAGAIRDMVQSHLLQLLSLVAMDKPKSLDNNAIRDEKIKVLKALKQFTDNDLKTNVIRGQYKSYLNEDKVNPNSQTETYVALKTYVENDRWRGVPFYIQTGKKMPVKTTEIIIRFKEVENNLYQDAYPNLLVFKIQPEEGVFLSFNAKQVGATDTIIPVKMDFCQNCEIGFNSPEAYERLLLDIMRGDPTLFARWDEVEYSWRFIDTIINGWKQGISPLFIYEDNSIGPKDADKLLKNV